MIQRARGKAELRARRPPRRLARWLLPLAVYAGVGAYYRFRPQPRGVDRPLRTYRLPVEAVRFLHNTVWYQDGERRFVHQVPQAICEMIRAARRFVVLDVFLFNLHHSEQGDFFPVTREVVDCFRGKHHPCYFITDPFNTFYGTIPCPPLDWLREAGVRVCVTDTRKLRDNNLVYSPAWRLTGQWIRGNGRGYIPHPLKLGHTTTVRALLEALNFKGNHRKVLVADEGDSYASLITSGNLEDSGSYYSECAIRIRSAAVARHFLESEKALARASGCEIEAEIPDQAEPGGEALVTPLLGDQIKRAVLADLRRTQSGQEVFVFMFFLAEREVVEALREAARRGVRVTLVLDPNRISFGSRKGGFPNQFVAAELAGEPNLEIRWGNTHLEELHSKFMFVLTPERGIVNLGSANFTRRGLSNTVLEANVRVEAPVDAPFVQEVLGYARWLTQEPRSLRSIPWEHSRLKYLWYRLQEAVGIATF